MPGTRLSVWKTYKLFIGGKFPRSESGRVLAAVNPKTGGLVANYSHGSKKDVRDAVVAARGAVSGWAGATAYLRGQILYRAAEMLESRAAAFEAELVEGTGATPAAARAEVEAAVDRLVYFAGWADKYSQVFGSVNAVASSHFNFSTPEPTGVVAVLAPDEPSLLGLVGALAPVLVSGNAAIVLASEKFPLAALSLAEALATSDFPGGVVNVLAGKRAELASTLASHMDVNAIVDASGDPAVRAVLQGGAATNLKRVVVRDLSATDWATDRAADGYWIMDTVETKTAWHPVGV